MPHIRFRLELDRYQVMRYYRGAARRVRVRADDGSVIDFDARLLRMMVQDGGISGLFEIEVDEHGRFRNLRRLGPV